jgi:superfamily I DNA/RNA helicase
MGVINSLSVETHEDGAFQTVEKIDELKEEIGYVGGDGKPNFGILVRTNAEAYAFAAECLKKEIPFRSKLNFFTDPTTKAVLKWLALANSSSTDRDVINDAVLTAHKSPGFLLDAYFETRLQKIASDYSKNVNYLEILRENYDNIYTGRSEWRNRNVLDYLDVLEKVFVMEGSPIDVMGKILDLRGVGFKDKPALSMKESLIEEMKKDADVMERINEQTNGNPTDEDLEVEALAPLKVLLDLSMKYEDTGPFVDYIRELQGVNKRKHKKDDPNAEDYEDPAVVIDTCHGWKGLEAHHVWIAMAGGTFPHISAEEKAEAGNTKDLEASRRLAYVAITRGQESVTVLSPKVSAIGKATKPSRFLDEACIQPMGMESNSEELDDDRIEKSASQKMEEIYDRILSDGDEDQEYNNPSDVLEEVWDFMG